MCLQSLGRLCEDSSYGLSGMSSPGMILLHLVSHPSTGKSGLIHVVSMVGCREYEQNHTSPLKTSGKVIPDSRDEEWTSPLHVKSTSAGHGYRREEDQ